MKEILATASVFLTGLAIALVTSGFLMAIINYQLSK